MEEAEEEEDEEAAKSEEEENRPREIRGELFSAPDSPVVALCSPKPTVSAVVLVAVVVDVVVVVFGDEAK